jgi:hypothetical protein
VEDREVAVAIAKRQLFVVAQLAAVTPEALDRVHELRERVAGMLSGDSVLPPSSGGGGSGSGPAELPLIELGITGPRGQGKA